MTQLLTVTEVAELLRCSRDHVYDLIADGEIPAVVDISRRHAGRRPKTRIDPADLAEYVERAKRRRPHRKGAA